MGDMCRDWKTSKKSGRGKTRRGQSKNYSGLASDRQYKVRAVYLG